MAEVPTLEDIIENINKVTAELQPTKTKNKNNKEVEKPADPLIALDTLRKCVEDIALFVKQEHTDKAGHAKTAQEHEDEIDHLKQKSLK